MKTKWVISGLVGLLVVLGFGYFFVSQEPYTLVKDEADYQAVMAEDTAYLYFGRDNCPYCQEFQPLLDEAITETGTEVYHYDTDDHAGEDDFQTILDTNEVVTVPKLVKLEGGEVVDSVDHTHSQKEIKELLR